MRPLQRLAREAARSAAAEPIRAALHGALKDVLAADLVRLLRDRAGPSRARRPRRRLPALRRQARPEPRACWPRASRSPCPTPAPAPRSSPAAPPSTASRPRSSSRSRWGGRDPRVLIARLERAARRSPRRRRRRRRARRRPRRRRLRPPRGRGAPRRRLRAGPRRRPRRQRAQRDARPAGDPAHARPRGRARARTPTSAASTSATPSRAPSPPPATASPRAGTAPRRPRRRAPRAACWRPAQTVVSHDYELEIADSADAVQDGCWPCRWCGTASCAACCRSAGATRRRIHDEDLHTIEAIAGLATRRLPQRRGLRARPARRPHRRADRRPQPRRDAGADPRGDRPRPPRRHAARRRHPRPRRLQERQRHPRPRGRRRAAAQGRPRAAGRAAARTTRSPATAATSSSCCSPAPTRR